MELIPLFGLGGIIAIIAFNAGLGLARRPDEDEMLRRLIELRTRRKLEAITRVDLDKEIDQAADRLTTQ